MGILPKRIWDRALGLGESAYESVLLNRNFVATPLAKAVYYTYTY